jgi:hypothetical protein
LDEDVLVVDVLNDVDVAILGVYLHDDGFDGGVAVYEYAFGHGQLVSSHVMVFLSWDSYLVEREA